jgi:hypothetical protein
VLSFVRFLQPVRGDREESIRALVQRVDRAAVRIGGEITAAIGRGVVVFLGVRAGDGDEHAFSGEKDR